MRGETQAASLRAYNLSILPEIPGGYGTGTDNFATFADGKSHTDATLYPNDNGQAMKRKDLIVIVCALALLSPFFLFPSVYEFYKEFNAQHGMVMSFIKFALLSTFGECIGLRIRVLERLGYVTLVECVLETGRTHQIRVHMKHIGHILFNDERYGGHEILKGTHFAKYKQFVNNCFDICPRQALHAMTLGFVHPVTGEEMYFTSELPDDMNRLLDKWRSYISNRELE